MTGDVLTAVWDWAWARHGNVLSWYVRPLFLVPLALAAHRRSGVGIVVTVLALLSSMAWFPAPATPDPQVRAFLAFEQEFLLGPWPAQKIALSALVPLSLAAYCAAFWLRSLRWGLAVLAGMALMKILWSVTAGGTGGTATVVPALTGRSSAPRPSPCSSGADGRAAVVTAAVSPERGRYRPACVENTTSNAY